MAKQQVTLYIDDSSISVLACAGRQPQKWSVVNLDAGLVKEGVVQDQQAVAAKIKEVWRSSRILRRKVTFGISGVNCFYQLLLLPELPENLRSEAISREAVHSLGIPLEGVYLSWQVVSIEHGQMKVFLTIVPRDKVDSVVATLKIAGLRPLAMDIKPLCLARVSSEPMAIMVDTCQDSFDIVVLGEGIPEVVRSLQMTPEMPPGERIAILRSELERSVSFYNAAHMDKPIDLTVPILVSGDLAGQESEMTSLGGPRERPVRNLESPLVELEGFVPGRYMTCMGLALKEILLTETGAVAYSVVNFNALPEIYQVRKRPLAEVMWLPSVAVGVVLIGMGIWGIVFLKGENSDLVSQRDNINRTIQEQRVREADITALDAQVKAAEGPPGELSSLLATLKADRNVITDDLETIESAAKDMGVSVGGISISAKGINVTALASSEDQALEYGRRLMESGRFSSVMITSISQAEEGVSFTVVPGR